MKIDDFDFDLPEALIAQHPVSPRDSSKMLVVGSNGLVDAKVTDITNYLSPGDVMVFNDTKVIPARLFGKRGAAGVEVTLFKRLETETECWECLIKNSKRLKTGDVINFAKDFAATVLNKLPDGKVIIDFHIKASVFMEKLAKYGTVPLPPYIRKGYGDEQDRNDYQTVYARYDGAIAAPTAGLHFSEELLQRIRSMGVKEVFLTLHVGGGTFLPVKAADTDDHVMHAEFGEISQAAAAEINAAKMRGNKVISVGTTSLRLLESAADDNGVVRAFSGYTDIFITPGYHFKAVDILMTNFHLPKSTLFILVSAFSGMKEMKTAYAHAIAAGYRFYSYGDSSLLFRRLKEIDPASSAG